MYAVKWHVCYRFLSFTGILRGRKKVSIATDHPATVTGSKHGLSEDDDDNDDPATRKRRRPLVRKQSTMVAQQGNVYAPDREEWPVTMVIY